jgi:hypothetical protein
MRSRSEKLKIVVVNPQADELAAKLRDGLEGDYSVSPRSETFDAYVAQL